MKLDFGCVRNIPPELRDVVVSFYYWFHIFAGRAIANEGLPMEVLSSGNVAGSLRSWIGDVAYWTSSIKAVPDFIKGFETISREKDGWLYDYTIEFVRNVLLYGNKNSMLPPILKRIILLFKRKRFEVINGISSLIEEAV